MPGYLALILHAHLPFVRHPEHEHFLEEDWFFEAVTESYIPLLRMMQRLLDDSVPFKLMMSLTPTLCAMLQDKLLRERYVQHLDNLIDLSAREQKRHRNHPQLRELPDFYFKMFCESVISCLFFANCETRARSKSSPALPRTGCFPFFNSKCLKQRVRRF